MYYGNLGVQRAVLSWGFPISVQGVNPKRTRERLASDCYQLSVREENTGSITNDINGCLPAFKMRVEKKPHQQNKEQELQGIMQSLFYFSYQKILQISLDSISCPRSLSGIAI